MGHFKLEKISKLDPKIKIKQMTIGGYGSTYIITNDDKLFVFGCNDECQLGLSEKVIVGIIISNWYKINIVHLDVLNLISAYIKDLLAWNSKAVYQPIYIKDFSVSYISKGIAAKHQFIITTHGNELYGVGYNEVNSISPNETINIKQHITSSWIKVDYFSKHKLKLKQITCAQYYTTFLSTNGHIFTVGRSFYGGLGFGQDINHLKELKQICFSDINIEFIDILSGCDHTLALTKCGNVWSWGRNQYGQLGAGEFVHNPLPQKIEFLVDNYNKSVFVKQIAIGQNHNVVLDTQNRLHCFRVNSCLQCGIESENDIFLPNIEVNKTLVNVNIIDIKCGANHNVIQTNNNEFYLWGLNSYSQCLVFWRQSTRLCNPVKFDQTEFLERGEVVISVIPGYLETRVITQSE
eukprot:298261_1